MTSVFCCSVLEQCDCFQFSSLPGESCFLSSGPDLWTMVAGKNVCCKKSCYLLSGRATVFLPLVLFVSICCTNVAIMVLLSSDFQTKSDDVDFDGFWTFPAVSASVAAD